MPPFLLCGLGNPSKNYRATRHNLGQLALGEIIARYSLAKTATKLRGELHKGELAEFTVLAFRPETFMNLCGPPIAAAMRFYKLSPADLVVIHDDTELSPGKVKAKTGGTDGGHNGVKSIDEALGTDYARIRIGIGRPPFRGRASKTQMDSHVLGRFTKAERAALEPILAKIAAALPVLLGSGTADFMQEMSK